MDGVHIKLTTPVEAFGTIYNELTLRQPKGGLYARLGEPRIVIANREGGIYAVEQPQVIKAYLEALVGVPNEDKLDNAVQFIILNEMTLEDAARLKLALFSFFDKAVAKATAGQ
jgi:hypothetical protein